MTQLDKIEFWNSIIEEVAKSRPSAKAFLAKGRILNYHEGLIQLGYLEDDVFQYHKAIDSAHLILETAHKLDPRVLTLDFTVIVEDNNYSIKFGPEHYLPPDPLDPDDDFQGAS
jgi:hypothetical protein